MCTLYFFYSIKSIRKVIFIVVFYIKIQILCKYDASYEAHRTGFAADLQVGLLHKRGFAVGLSVAVGVDRYRVSWNRHGSMRLRLRHMTPQSKPTVSTAPLSVEPSLRFWDYRPLSLRDISSIRGITSTPTRRNLVCGEMTELRGYGFAITPLSALQTSPLSGESRSSLPCYLLLTTCYFFSKHS